MICLWFTCLANDLIVIYLLFPIVDWRFAPLTMAIKSWANEHGINNAFKKSISSYSLVLMVIHFLQGNLMAINLMMIKFIICNL